MASYVLLSSNDIGWRRNVVKVIFVVTSFLHTKESWLHPSPFVLCIFVQWDKMLLPSSWILLLNKDSKMLDIQIFYRSVYSIAAENKQTSCCIHICCIYAPLDYCCTYRILLLCTAKFSEKQPCSWSFLSKVFLQSLWSPEASFELMDGQKNTSCNRCTAVVTVPLCVKPAEVVGRTRAVYVYEAFSYTHISRIHICLFTFRTNVWN